MNAGSAIDKLANAANSEAAQYLAAPFQPIFWYFQQLHIKGYEGIIKIALRNTQDSDVGIGWLDYWKFFTSSPLPNGTYLNVAHNAFIAIIILLTVVLILSYNIRCISQVINTKRTIMGFKKLLAAYLFAFLPFKNTCLIRPFQADACPFSSIFKVDIILFLLVLSIFRILTYITKKVRSRSKRIHKTINYMSGNAKFIAALYVIVSLLFKMLLLMPSYPVPIILSIVLIAAIFMAEFSIRSKDDLITLLKLLHENCFKGIEKYLFLYLDHYITIFCFAICFSYLSGFLLPAYKCYLIYFDLVYGWSLSPEVALLPVLFKIVHLFYFLEFSFLLKKIEEI